MSKELDNARKKLVEIMPPENRAEWERFIREEETKMAAQIAGARFFRWLFVWLFGGIVIGALIWGLSKL
jgi:hypothetical protein